MEDEPLGFEHMGLDARLLQAITDLGWSRPTLIQEKAIPLALEGKDLLARARTGSGKTAAYAVPLLQHLLHRKETGPVVEQAVRGLVLVPTKELAQQAQTMIRQLAAYCARDVRVVDVSAVEDSATQRALLMEKPDVVVGTPSRVHSHLQQGGLVLRDSLELLVMDEADLLFSFGFEEELKSLLCHLPRIYQAFLMSATFNEDVQALKELVLHNPVTLKLQESQLPGPERLQQFQVLCEAEEDKFLLLYALLKLRLLRGKSLLFVNTVERSYRLRLFLEQFSIPACVLNGELPLRSRCHIISQFNQGFYDCIIATDGVIRRERARKGEKASDPEAGVARGIDFHNVAAVLNFDLPPSPEAYVHRAGRYGECWAGGPGNMGEGAAPGRAEPISLPQDGARRQPGHNPDLRAARRAPAAGTDRGDSRRRCVRQGHGAELALLGPKLGRRWGSGRRTGVAVAGGRLWGRARCGVGGQWSGCGRGAALPPGARGPRVMTPATSPHRERGARPAKLSVPHGGDRGIPLPLPGRHAFRDEAGHP
uniref:Probable ATP-dependent RNA helicase DDX56 n=1 Tax=Ornithorhynchus anatinus TaxID=9258 RepID=F6R6G7_ORNAN